MRNNDNQRLFSRKERKERKVLFTFRISRWRWSGRKLRYDKSAQSFYPPPPPCGVLPPVSGGESVTTDGYKLYSLPFAPSVARSQRLLHR